MASVVLTALQQSCTAQPLVLTGDCVSDTTGCCANCASHAGETTAVGEPLPGPEGRLVAAAGSGPWQQQRPASFGAVLTNSLAVGFGVGLVFAVIRLVF